MLLDHSRKQVHVDTRKVSPKLKDKLLAPLTEVLAVLPYRDAPRGFFSLGERARTHSV